MGTSNMKIAVLSGKGGTGKTLVSVNLAAVAQKSIYIDCDVEEPNGYLFFKPQGLTIQNVSVMIPTLDKNKCIGCRKCVDFCKFNALAYIKGKPIVFGDICHSCGGCVLLCPENALSEIEKIIGVTQYGVSENVTVMTGLLNTGEATGIPIIKKLMDDIPCESPLTIIDCPPGSSCIVMESIKSADYCILVAEPTIFGVHNLNMVYELVRLFDKPFGVVLNKCIEGENPSESYCIQHNIPILAEIPYNNKLGSINSNGFIAVREKEEYRNLFSSILLRVMKEGEV